jgi:hypothetical protein
MAYSMLVLESQLAITAASEQDLAKRQERLLQLRTEVELLATPRVAAEARKLTHHAIKSARAKGGWTEEKARSLRNLSNDFIQAARAELGIMVADPAN